MRRKKPPKKGKSDIEIPGRLSTLVAAGLAPIRQLRPVRELSQQFPETELTAMDAKWYRLAKYDSAIVSMNDGTSAAMYQRDPEIIMGSFAADQVIPDGAESLKRAVTYHLGRLHEGHDPREAPKSRRARWRNSW